MNPARRIQKEISDIQNDKDSSLTITVVDGTCLRSCLYASASFDRYMG